MPQNIDEKYLLILKIGVEEGSIRVGFIYAEN